MQQHQFRCVDALEVLICFSTRIGTLHSRLDIPTAVLNLVCIDVPSFLVTIKVYM
jgi:hypothetical protein